MIALFIRADVAVDTQLRMAAAAGLTSVCVELATVEALGTMRFRSLLERHAATVVTLYGDRRDPDSDRLRDIAQVLWAEPVIGAPSIGWTRLQLDAVPDLLAILRAATRDHVPHAARLELAPSRAAWHATAGSVRRRGSA